MSVVPEDADEDELEEEEECKLRLERSMEIRALYQEAQDCWQQFRDAEERRRIEKANACEIDRLNSIIRESRARREHTASKFQQTQTVRAYHQAALVLQRAFRRTRRERAARARSLWAREIAEEGRRERAALIVQRAWRRWRQKRFYEAMHFVSIATGPVVALQGTRRGAESCQHPPGAQHYQKAISITGQSVSHSHVRFVNTG